MGYKWVIQPGLNPLLHGCPYEKGDSVWITVAKIIRSCRWIITHTIFVNYLSILCSMIHSGVSIFGRATA